MHLSLGKIGNLEEMGRGVLFGMILLEGEKIMGKSLGMVKDKGRISQLKLVVYPFEKLTRSLDAHMLGKKPGMSQQIMQKRLKVLQWQAS